MTPGIRMSEVSPDPPIGMGNPSTLFTITTATAPACWAARTLLEKKQVPRSMRAILPLTSAALETRPLSPS